MYCVTRCYAKNASDYFEKHHLKRFGVSYKILRVKVASALVGGFCQRNLSHQASQGLKWFQSIHNAYLLTNELTNGLECITIRFTQPLKHNGLGIADDATGITHSSQRIGFIGRVTRDDCIFCHKYLFAMLHI